MKFTVEVESRFNSDDLILIRSRSIASSNYPDRIIVGLITGVYYDSKVRKIMYNVQLAPKKVSVRSAFLNVETSIDIPEAIKTYQFPETVPDKLKEYIRSVIMSGDSERTLEILKDSGIDRRMSRGDLALYVNYNRHDRMISDFSVELRKFAGYSTLDINSPMLFDSHRGDGEDRFANVDPNDVMPIPGFKINIQFPALV